MCGRKNREKTQILGKIATKGNKQGLAIEVKVKI